MSEIFLKIFNMSISASWLILEIIIIRPFLKKAPKRILCLLWAIVAVRLILPFSIESIFSLIPSSETIPPGIEFKQNPAINSGVAIMQFILSSLMIMFQFPMQALTLCKLHFLSVQPFGLQEF